MSMTINMMYKCLFCCGSTNYFQQNENHLTLQQIITSCNNHLTREFVGGIDWKSVTSVSGSFCQECYIVVEKLVCLTDRLNRILNDIKELDTNLINRVSRERKNNEQSTSTFYNVDVGVNAGNNFDIYAPKITTKANIIDSSHWNLETSALENNPLIQNQSERNFTASQERSNSPHDVNTSPETGEYEEEFETLSGDAETNQGKRKSVKKKTNLLKEDSAPPKPKIVVTASDLLRHEKSGAPGYECDKCHKRFSRLTILNRHDCSSPTIECEVCKISFSGSGVLKLHMRCHTGEKPFKCETCGKCFAIKQHLTIHLRQHTGERPFKCEICEKTFREQGQHSKHMATHSKTVERLYKCDICLKSYITPRELKNHLLYHKEDRPYKCDTCGKSFVRNSLLKQHLRQVNYHSGENPFKCGLCEKAFPHQYGLNAHMANIHSGKDKVLCQQCGKCFVSNENLAIHMLTHTEKGPFICESCGKKYPSSVRLKEHIQVYHSDKAIKCETCGKIYKRQTELLKHQKDLECGGPPFKCTECDETFETKVARDRHKIMEHVSENERPTFPCKKCSEKFQVKQDLAQHLRRIHRESRDASLALSVPCETCKKNFKNEQNLKLHKKKCNTQCSECAQLLSSKCEYNVHRQEHLKRKKGGFCKACNLSFVDPKFFQVHMKSCHPIESLERKDNAEESQPSRSRENFPRKCKLKSAESDLCSSEENNEIDESDCESDSDNDDEELLTIKEEQEEDSMSDSEIKTEYVYD